MLPRTLPRPARLVAVACAIGLLVPAAPAQGARSHGAPVSINALAARPAVAAARPGSVTLVVYPKSTVPTFSLVGLTWTGAIDPTTRFRARVREAGTWSRWQTLALAAEHGPDGVEATQVKAGTDPLLSAPADGIQIKAVNRTGVLPADLSVSLVDSSVTAADRAAVAAARSAVSVPASVVSPSGAIAWRPTFVTRAQWGADETWRDSEVAVAPQVNAVFIHHTATTNNYSASQGPAQMRGLYAYFTKVKLYKDVAYNFLVDKYGTVYEGRSGCPRDPVLAADCDGPSVPAVGAHTAGLNTGTFAISVIGNYDTKAPTKAQARRILNSLARTVAWKFAPTGVDPNGRTTMQVGSDPLHKSRYTEGDTAVFPSISGHRDVGRTACPGRYMYPYLPRLRTMVAQLLTPVIANTTAAPGVANVAEASPVAMSMLVPADSTWAIDVTAADGTVVGHADGTQGAASETVTYDWPHTAGDASLLPAGAYTASFNVTHGESVLPTVHSTVYLATPPAQVASVAVSRVSRTTADVTWPAVDNAAPVSYKYRVYRVSSGTWSAWRYTSAGSTRAVLRKLRSGARYRVEVIATNALGESGAVPASYRHR